MGLVLLYLLVIAVFYWLFVSMKHAQTKLNFNEAKYLVALLAKVAKSDGRVNELEARLISQTLDDIIYKIQGSTNERDELKRIFNAQKQELHNAYEMARSYRLNQHLSYEIRIARLTFFINLAFIDGEFKFQERKIIQDIANGFDIDELNLQRLIERFYKFYKTQQNSGFKERKNGEHQNPYDVLGIPRDSEFDAVKKRYRELVKKYHPDILMGQGESEAVIEKSTKKLQEINDAYESIKRSVGE